MAKKKPKSVKKSKLELRAIVHASELLTGAGFRRKDGRRVGEDDIGRVTDGAMVYSVHKIRGRSVPARIEWVGETSQLPKKYARVKAQNLHGKRAVVAGFVDCHTHLVFAGDRSDEFADRCGGATYADIAARGGGIVKTVSATREASEKELERLACERVKEMARYGVRTIEVKSGYGLDVETELKCLRVAGRLREKFPELTFQVTFLGAHAFPKEKTRPDYLRELLEEQLPRVAHGKLADCCDVFVDEGYFHREEGRELLLKARAMGLGIKIHADELANTESAALAADIGALSADHLLKVSDEGIRKLGASQTVAVLLPGTAFYLKAPHAPARRLIDAGACVAISTDFNPGTSMTLSLPAVMTIAALYLGMSRAELLASVTYNAAKALGLQGSKGTLEEGMDADFAILPFPRFDETYYRFAWR